MKSLREAWTSRGARITIHRATRELKCSGDCRFYIQPGDPYIEVNMPIDTKLGITYITKRYCMKCWRAYKYEYLRE